MLFQHTNSQKTENLKKTYEDKVLKNEASEKDLALKVYIENILKIQAFETVFSSNDTV